MYTRHRESRPVVPSLRHSTAAIVWIDARHALIARTAAGHEVEVREVRAADPVRPRSPYLAEVAHELGNRDRIVVLGPEVQRLDLEREYVGIFHRPERILDRDEWEVLDRDELVARLHQLTGD